MRHARYTGKWKWRNANEHDVATNSMLELGEPVVEVGGQTFPIDLRDYILNDDGTVSPPWTMKALEITNDNLYEFANLIGGDVVFGWKTANNFVSHDSIQKSYPQAYIVSDKYGIIGIGDVMVIDNRGWRKQYLDMMVLGDEVDYVQ